jgi:Family of unknown function (DUF6084)
MPDLDFQVQSAEPVLHAAAPLLHFKLRLAQHNPVPIHTVALRCQIRIEPARRRYAPGEQEPLLDLFGTPDRWGQTLSPMLWTHTSLLVPSFTSELVTDLPVPCSYDFNVAATKYFYALEQGEVPLCLLFSGTIFYQAADGRLQVAQIPWDKEANFRLPVQVWKDLMHHYYADSAWLQLRRDAFNRLYHYKRQHALPTWEQALERLLDAADVEVGS